MSRIHIENVGKRRLQQIGKQRVNESDEENVRRETAIAKVSRVNQFAVAVPLCNFGHPCVASERKTAGENPSRLSNLHLRSIAA
jgi:hypothetical protein